MPKHRGDLFLLGIFDLNCKMGRKAVLNQPGPFPREPAPLLGWSLRGAAWATSTPCGAQRGFSFRRTRGEVRGTRPLSEITTEMQDSAASPPAWTLPLELPSPGPGAVPSFSRGLREWTHSLPAVARAPGPSISVRLQDGLCSKGRGRFRHAHGEDRGARWACAGKGSPASCWGACGPPSWLAEKGGSSLCTAPAGREP